MELITYLLASAAAFSGLAVGMIVGFFAWEEVNPGRQYLKLLQSVIFMLALVALLHYMQAGILLKIALYPAAAVFLLKFNASELSYPLLAIMMYAASNREGMLMVAGMVFLYGLPTGSIALEKNKDVLRQAGRILIRHSSFLLISILLILQFS